MRVIIAEPGRTPTPVPYRTEGDPTRRFLDLRAEPELIEIIPELRDRPQLKRLVQVLNDPERPFYTIGCERSLTPLDEPELPGEWECTSYVQFAFADRLRSRSIAAYRPLMSACQRQLRDVRVNIAGCVELQPDPLAFVDEPALGWSITVWTHGFGAGAVAAERDWSVGMGALIDFFSSSSELWEKRPVS